VLARLGPWCHDHRRLVLGLWVALLVVSNGVAGRIGEDYHADFSLPGQESTEGFDVLTEEFGGQGTGWAGTIVFRAEQGVENPEVKAAMQRLFTKVADLPGDDRRQDHWYSSSILPAYMLKSPKVTEVLPILYLRGLSTGDFAPPLGEFFGSSAGMSASTVQRLTEAWQAEQTEWCRRDLWSTLRLTARRHAGAHP
jgi:hypothetical protein